VPAPRYETVDEEPLRDPFEDQGYGESAAGGRYGAIEDPYEAIRKVRQRALSRSRARRPVVERSLTLSPSRSQSMDVHGRR